MNAARFSADAVIASTSSEGDSTSTRRRTSSINCCSSATGDTVEGALRKIGAMEADSREILLRAATELGRLLEMTGRA